VGTADAGRQLPDAAALERSPPDARAAMQEFLGTVQQQMRLITALAIVNHALSMGLIASTADVALWL
jgi:ATP-binding cassette subfamily B multidrug efflux pump